MSPIADMLTIIRNGLAVSKKTVKIPFSNFKFEIAKILEKEGLVDRVEKKGRTEKFIEINLKYLSDNQPVISGLRIVSRPGQRIYLGSKEIKKVKGGGVAIVSTSKGLMTGKEAKKQKIGGEVLCEVW